MPGDLGPRLRTARASVSPPGGPGEREWSWELGGGRELGLPRTPRHPPPGSARASRCRAGVGGHNQRPATPGGSLGLKGGGVPKGVSPKSPPASLRGCQYRSPSAASAAESCRRGQPCVLHPSRSRPPSRIPPSHIPPSSIPLLPAASPQPHLPPIPPAFRFPSPIPPTLRFSPILRAWRCQSPAGRPGWPPATPLGRRHLWLGLDEGGCAGREAEH